MLEEFQFCDIDIPKLISSKNDILSQFTENKLLKNNFIPFPFYTFCNIFKFLIEEKFLEMNFDLSDGIRMVDEVTKVGLRIPLTCLKS